MEELLGNAVFLLETVARAFPSLETYAQKSPISQEPHKMKTKRHKYVTYEEELEQRRQDQQKMISKMQALPNRDVHERFMHEAIAMVCARCGVCWITS